MPRPSDYVTLPPALLGVVPKPEKAELSSGEFKFGDKILIAGIIGEWLLPVFKTFGVEAIIDDSAAQIFAIENSALGAEAYSIEVTPEKISIAYGDYAGFVYAMGTMEQLLYLAFRYGRDQALLECGVIEDRPNFKFRCMMIDCARHFQSVATVKRLLKAMSRLRMNYFHWHLVDNHGWRLPSDGCPELNAIGSLDKGFYTKEDIAEIRSFAKRYAIEIIPEIDFPGHNHGALSLHPELRCLPDSYGNEICLGGEASMAFVKARYDEAFALFPESKYFHIGGDEAWDGWWRQCPKCQAKMKALGLSTPRKLEEWFMRELSQYIVDKGLTPISWQTEAVLTPKNILQCWGNAGNMYNCAHHDEGKNLVISSMDVSYYIDYPQSSNEPRLHWMPMLMEEAVYMANPACHMEKVLGDRLIGGTLPLWTEVVPEWRVGTKLFPRLVAGAEALWTSHQKKYSDYLDRRQALEFAGYCWW
ncbi:MAG: beta-N-acetylhexosaminidase [Lentisphaeria bacterium]|nr:beta-N-acetylhexosaminidase [Lentisphaeria bacterium]